jgi:hypothetical protein
VNRWYSANFTTEITEGAASDDSAATCAMDHADLFSAVRRFKTNTDAQAAGAVVRWPGGALI